MVGIGEHRRGAALQRRDVERVLQQPRGTRTGGAANGCLAPGGAVHAHQLLVLHARGRRGGEEQAGRGLARDAAFQVPADQQLVAGFQPFHDDRVEH